MSGKKHVFPFNVIPEGPSSAQIKIAMMQSNKGLTLREYAAVHILSQIARKGKDLAQEVDHAIEYADALCDALAKTTEDDNVGA